VWRGRSRLTSVYDESELQNAALLQDLDGFMKLVTVDEVVDAWCRFASGGAEALNGPDGWAWGFFQCRELSNRSDLFRELLVKIIDRVDDDLLCAVGAGPLETFFSSELDDRAWLAEQARNDERFQRALACLTWMNEDNVRVLVEQGRWTFLELPEAPQTTPPKRPPRSKRQGRGRLPRPPRH